MCIQLVWILIAIDLLINSLSIYGRYQHIPLLGATGLREPVADMYASCTEYVLSGIFDGYSKFYPRMLAGPISQGIEWQSGKSQLQQHVAQ